MAENSIAKNIERQTSSTFHTSKPYISVLRVFACLAVLLLHTNGAFWEFNYEPYWLSANIIESLFYFAVPVFFMISGVTLLNYRERQDTKTYIRKRIAKTVIPFIGWSFIGLLNLIISKQIIISDLNAISIINSIFNTSYVHIYWFFIALFTIYLCIPVLSLIPKGYRQTCFLYIIIVSFLLNSFFPFLCNLTQGKIQYNGALNMPLGSHYLIYVLAGYYIDNYEIKKRGRHILYILGLGGGIAHIGGTWYLSYKYGEISNLFKGYVNVPCILYSIAIFCFFKHIDYNKWKSYCLKTVSFFDKETFGIYLVHWFILSHITSTGIFNTHSLMFRIFGGIILFISSGFVIKIIKRISCLKFLVP